jgi:Uncharacterized conserved protein (DUF2075)
MIQRAYYKNTIPAFLSASTPAIFGELAKSHGFDLVPLQREAWLTQITNLQEQLQCFNQGDLFLEFSIPRMGKRVDALLLIQGIIFLVEYKVGAKQYAKQAIDQVTDYALDLKNFHEGSHTRRLLPILVATDATESFPGPIIWSQDHVATAVLSRPGDVGKIILRVIAETAVQPALNANAWSNAGYKPTPTIIEAAQALYRTHSVEELSRSEAGAINLTETSRCIFDIMDESKRNRRKSVCFVTGVPGSGKTLAGLNITTQRLKIENDNYAVFLSGNGPLVSVLREALALDKFERALEAGGRVSKKRALSEVSAFIQNIHHFRDEYLPTDRVPLENVVIFDEAQRAWDQLHAEKFMRKRGHSFSASEPEFLISVMDRKEPWCTIVCLVGGGQEINTGEAGLVEWVRALEKRFRHWDVYASDRINDKEYSWGQELSSKLASLGAQQKSSLHLSVSIRSFRAEKLSDFVGAVIEGDIDAASRLRREIGQNFPLVLTRNIQKAREWLKSKARGSERYGVVASSGALRLKPDGIFARSEMDPVKWFLNPREDVRSSYYLEDVATEFAIQGLELDWTCVCWDADLRRTNNAWETYAFVGTRWQVVRDVYRRVYLANAYRVLLTRSRQGMVIFVPSGDEQDPTRRRHFYDETYDYLGSCGLTTI